MGGLDLIVAIRQTHAALPVVILTGHASLTTAVEALRLGVRDYVFKPVHLEQLLGRIEDILHERDAERRQREILAELKSLVGRWEALETECQTQFTDQTPTATDHLLQRGPFRLDLLARRATIDGRALNITATSFDYLATLALHAPDAIAPEVLLWESQGYTESHLRAHEMVRWRIHSLRRAVETEPSNPRFILTVRGVGYRLAV
jgi:two-component system KDP operon response regulator KdpE